MTCTWRARSRRRPTSSTARVLPPGWDGFAPTAVGGRWAYDTMHWRHITNRGRLGISFGWQGIGGFAAQFTTLGGKNP